MLKNKILHVIGALVAGGAERFVVDLLCEAKSRGLDVSLLILSSRNDNCSSKMEASLIEAGISYDRGPSHKVFLSTIIWYANRIKQIKPDIVHLHTANTEIVHYFSTLFNRVRYLEMRTLHNTELPPYPILFLRHILRRSSAIRSIACSNSVKHVYKDIIGHSIAVIKNGIGFNWPIRTGETALLNKKQLNMNPDYFHFLHVGNFKGEDPENCQKGQDILLRAWKVLLEKNNRCWLHFIGDGSLRSIFQNHLMNSQNITFHGVQSNVSNWLIATDCFVMPSRWEGLPIAGIEAAGTGVPCIFSDIPELREVAAPKVLWASVGDVNALAENMLHKRLNPIFPSFDEVAAFRDRFHISKVLDQYARVYQEISEQ